MNISPYSILYRKELAVAKPWSFPPWDVFISAFNSSDRVREVYSKVPAKHKFWMIHSEYGYGASELPSGNCYVSTSSSEADYTRGLVDRVEQVVGAPIGSLSICIDITGFMRPHLIFLPYYLKTKGVIKYDVLYSEPMYYAKKEQTVFSEGTIVVRQIEGYEGVNSTDQSNDFLIVGAGYDHRLIKAVAENKDKADKVQIYGLPSLRPDMYQENVMRARRAADAIGANKVFDRDSFFAPASDPFVTAEIVSEIVKLRKRSAPISNLYLSPLATKPQALGFALFYLSECAGTAASILFPVSSKYARETSVGLERVWQYTVE
jgi:hypothetical protein